MKVGISPGIRVGHLVCLKMTETGRRAKGFFECDCGNKKEIRIDSIKTGRTKSCGCMQTTEFTKPETTFEEGIRRLAEYKASFGTANIPRCDKNDPTLSRWLIYQRTKFRDGLLSEEETAALRDAGVSLRPLDERWESAAIEFLTWMKTQKRVPSRYAQNDENEVRLWRFGHRHIRDEWKVSEILQRILKKKGGFSEDALSIKDKDLLAQGCGVFHGKDETGKYLLKNGFIVGVERLGSPFIYWIISKKGELASGKDKS